MSDELTPMQYEELLLYADGEPHNFGARPNNNLIRRNALVRESYGDGAYRITTFGRALLDMRAPRLDDLITEAKSEFERGYVEGLMAYAWWKSGVQYVGSTGTTLKQAIQRFYTEHREGRSQ